MNQCRGLMSPLNGETISGVFGEFVKPGKLNVQYMKNLCKGIVKRGRLVDTEGVAI
jgi:hypothetical protein